ncbi:MAG: hypothetical protein RLZZ225_388 [Pseudomonadota bacterium]|jgi:hypothetical protein
MPTIRSAATPLGTNLPSILNTSVDQWPDHFIRQTIKSIFDEASRIISSQDFFTDEQLNKFLKFLTVYVKSELTSEKLSSIEDTELLQKFDWFLQGIQKRMLDLTERQVNKEVFSNYLQFLHLLMENKYRDLFTRSEIKFAANDLQAIATVLQRYADHLDENLIKKYSDLLKLSFDVPKFLKQSQPIASGVVALAKACFLNKKLNRHELITQFFKLLGYQGQLLNYYHHDSRFNISAALLTQATDYLATQAIDLQTYLFNQTHQTQEFNKPLLQHYFYSYFFKELHKENAANFSALAKNPSWSPYMKTDYVALPHHFDCSAYLPADYQVRLEYADLPQDILQMACQAIACSQKSHKAWKSSLNLNLPTFHSKYVFRLGNSYEDYERFPYAYGYPPLGGGFYISGGLENNTVAGTGYSYWGNSAHNFINVARHEAVHHDNYRLYRESLRVNRRISTFINRNFDEGLAVLLAGGACTPGYVNKDLFSIPPLNLQTLLQNEYIGYQTSWLYNNYLLQQHPSFYADQLRLNGADFNNTWSAILNNQHQAFINWRHDLNQTCQHAAKELSLENCPSIYLKDYLPQAITKTAVTTERLPRTSHFSASFFTTRSPDSLGRELILKIHANNISEFQHLLIAGANPNYRDPYNGNSVLHYLFHYDRCDAQWLQLLVEAGAQITANNAGKSAYDLAAERCTVDALQAIKEILTRFESNVTTAKTHETEIVTYQPKPSQVTLVLPLYALSSLLTGAVSAFSDEAGRRYKASYPYLPAVICYGIKPVVLSMASASMDSLLLGTANRIGFDEVASSFLSYFAMNYLGLLIAQVIEHACAKKIENKVISFLLPVLLYTSLLNPGLLFSEGFITQWMSLLVMPIINGLLFQLGRLGAHKLLDSFFPENLTANDLESTYVAYNIDGTPKNHELLDDSLNLSMGVQFTFESVDASEKKQPRLETFRYEAAPPLPPKQTPKLQRWSIFNRQSSADYLPLPPTAQELAEIEKTMPRP